MELPKNMKQIGESDRHCRVYVEDYVYSYIKQVNKEAGGHSATVAMYGTRKEEDGVSYLFFYGAGKIQPMQKAMRHLSQAQLQEIDKLRKRFFPKEEFLGYAYLNGEITEGFYIFEQGVCRYVGGYACFYEKNEAMLAYMLDSRKEEAVPENIDREKYERVRLRQEERKKEVLAEEKKETKQQKVRRKKERTVSSASSLRMVRTAAVGLFALLGVLGISLLSDSGEMKELQTAAGNLIAEFSEQKLKTDDEIKKEDKNTLVAEDKLTEAILEENEPAKEETKDRAACETQEQADDDADRQQEEIAEEKEETVQEQIPETSQQETQTQEQPPADTQEAASTQTYSSYTIKRGDTLISISMNQYGTDTMVKEICTLNNIQNPDDIYYGQKILLP